MIENRLALGGSPVGSKKAEVSNVRVPQGPTSLARAREIRAGGLRQGTGVQGPH